MAACYAIETFSWVTAGGAHMMVYKGAKRDTVTSPVAVALPAKFTASPPLASQAGGISGELAAYLVTYPNGPEL